MNGIDQTLIQISREFAKKEQIINELYCINKILQMCVKGSNQHLAPEIRPAPTDLRRSADAVTDGNILYLRQAEQNLLYRFNVQNGELVLPIIPCEYLRCSMVVFDNQLVTIGGATSKESKAPRSNELLSLAFGALPDQFMWQSILPCMPTKRSRTTALTFNRFIIVIGGEDEDHNILTRVEILDTMTRTWQQVQDLPDTRCCSSGTIANGYIYILGGWRGVDPVSSVLRCSVNSLLGLPPAGIIAGTEQPGWETLCNLPVEEAACTSLCDTVLVVGGRANKDPVADIRTYNPVNERWEVIGYIEKRRYICFATGLNDRLIVVGGRKEQTITEDTIEIHQFRPLP